MFRRALCVALAVLAAACAGLIGAARADDAPKPAAPAGDTDAAALVAKIRALGVVDDPKSADMLLDFVAQPSALVRATATVALLKMSRPECVERLRAHGLAHADGNVRACAARVCGRLHLASAKPSLRAMIADDKLWLARSEAAIACGELGDVDAKAAIVKLLSDPSNKARLGAIDALGLLGPAAADAVPAVASNLESAQWQLRVAACQALGRIGSMEAVEPLIDRMWAEESGRVGGDIYDALKTIGRVDVGRKLESWWNWWEAEKAKKSKRPPTPFPFGFGGIEVFHSRVGFVLDTSASMEQVFDPDAAATKSLTRSYSGVTKLAICKEEIAQALASLDPRSYFSVIALGAPTRSFADKAVRPSKENVASAVEWLRPIAGAGRADAFLGLHTILSLDDGPDLPGYNGTLDTVTLVTDGTSTIGEMSPDALVEWFTALDRYARIRLSVTSLGEDGGNLDPLRAIAERSGGRFTCLAARTR